MKKSFPGLTMYLIFLGSFLLNACASHSNPHNQLSDQEKKDGWALLFDGTTMNGWHIYNRGNLASAWSVDSGNLICNPHAKNVKHGDLVTDKAFENFDLVYEWKISKGGNSGLFINVQESPEYGTTWATGPEYQLLDNANNEEHGRDPMRMAGSLYGVTDIKNNAAPRSFAEWNQSRIVQQSGKITFWLNGIITVQEDLNSERWKDLVAKSSLGQFPAFGKATSGKLALQDWTNGVSFRDIKIKSSGSASAPGNMEISVPGVEKLNFSDTIQLKAGEDMRFDQDLFRVKTGKKIRLILTNTAKKSGISMTHNVVILAKGTDIADFADVAHNAKDEQYVPSSVASSVIAHSHMVGGGESEEIEFVLPQAGVYDFICSFPGHWGTMQGKIVAE